MTDAREPKATPPSSVEYRQFDFRTKALHHASHIARYLDGERPVPLNVEIDLTNACNHRCSFCQWAGYIQESRATLSTDIVTRTLRELALLGTKSINFTGGGEPTLHRDFHELLELSHRLGLESGLLTNGSRFAPAQDDALLDRLVWLRVSMAGGDRESYRAVQGCDDFDLVIENLRRLAARKRARGGATELGVGMLVNRANAATLRGLAQTLGGIGLDYLQVRQDMFSSADDVAWWRAEIAPMLADLAAVSERAGLRVLGARYVDAQADLGFPSKCHAHHFVLAINADGFVCFCKNTRDKPDFYLGNLRERTFTEIWKSSLRVRELEGLICPANCATFCKNMDINAAVESVARGDAEAFGPDAPRPVHLNFL